MSERRLAICYAPVCRRLPFFAEQLLKQLLRPSRAFLRKSNGLGSGLGIADHAFRVQSIKRLPVMAFPSSERTTIFERREVEQGKDSVIDLVSVYFHADLPFDPPRRRMAHNVQAQRRCEAPVSN